MRDMPHPLKFFCRIADVFLFHSASRFTRKDKITLRPIPKINNRKEHHPMQNFYLILNGHGLDIHKLFNPEMGQFPPISAILYTAEWQRRIGFHKTIDRNVPRIQ